MDILGYTWIEVENKAEIEARNRVERRPGYEEDRSKE